MFEAYYKRMAELEQRKKILTKRNKRRIDMKTFTTSRIKD